MKWFKEYAKDFPTLGAGAVLGLGLLASMGIIVDVRLALGLPFPDGYDTWIIALLGLSGVTTLGMIGKRYTDREYGRVTNPVQQPSPVNVEGAGTVVQTGEPVVKKEGERGDD